ncbi:helix-turn-helix domain-containing protein [Actinomadura sediminis]|uniref:Helix-turn-helix domain-containing protein n=1 Tax=Actinomadura sediminis TaxID=1038904 RepID=A0ABW3ESZ7_9ACTN
MTQRLSTEQAAAHYGTPSGAMDADRAAEVARVYRAAARTGHGPTKAVAAHFKVSRATAGRWVAHARHTGLLKDEPRRNPKALAVAQALGVPYEDLCRAIRDHAGGDLRVTDTHPALGADVGE